jgi:hypothetical protein
MASKKSGAIVPRNFTLPENAPDLVRGSSLFDESDPDSVFNKTSDKLHEVITTLGTHVEARRVIRNGEAYAREHLKPTAQMARIRIGFWDEYARSVSTGQKMSVDRIYAGVMSKETFEDEYYTDPKKLGYVLLTPPHYHRAAEEILLLGLERMRDIIELPLINSRGQVQVAVVNGILKAVEMLDKRVKGAIMQKVAIHQHNTNGGALPATHIPPDALATDELGILEAEILNIRKRLDKRVVELPDENFNYRGGKIPVDKKVEVVED